MKLYEYDEALDSCYNEETGEFDEERFEQLSYERDTKIEGIALAYKCCLSDAEAIKAEEKNLAARRKALENKADSIKNFLNYSLKGEKFKTAKVAVSFKKSTKTVVSDNFVSWAIATGNDCYLKQKEPEVSLTSVKEALTSGKDIPAQLVESLNIQIK